ncbi:AAA family ATPase [Streptomyces sp. NPDC000609]|uniref:AAA family ATPase n=1 Tax=Streptomyces sp. NPDC000609 TaxID=3160957 RepID=UPI003392A70F
MTATSWDILLIGGASGIGKSRAAAQLAGGADESRAFVVEFDDVVSAVESMTTAEHHPALHHFDTVPDPARLSVDQVLDLQIATAEALEPAVLGVVRNRLTVDVPAVIEGDYLTPAAAAEAIREGRTAGRRVRAVFLHEPDPEQIHANYAAREPDSGEQRHRAQVSAAYSHWLAGQAARHGLPVVECRPWTGLAVRLERALGKQDGGGALSDPRPTLGP